MSSLRHVVAAGLTPAWQQIVVLDALRWGEVNRAQEVHWCASGKVLNVGRALAALGTRQTTVALVGGFSGQQIQAEWSAAGIEARWVVAAQPTRVCTTVIERELRSVTELVENAAAVSPAELAEFAQAYSAAASAAAVAVLTGSLPKGAPADWYRQALRSADCPAILDVRGPELLAALDARPLLVKPNREELARTAGHALQREEDVWAAIDSLRTAGAHWALITQGAEPALLAGPGGRWRVAPLRNVAVNPIGCGDCLAAGIAAYLAAHCEDISRPSNAEMLAAVQFGTAAAAENAQTLLPARLDVRRVEQQAPSVWITALDS